MKHIILAVLFAFAVSPILSIAQSNDHKIYVGGHIGQAKAQSSCDGLAGTGISCDDTDTSWKVLGGYKFSRNFAAELGYIDFGEIKASAPGVSVSFKSHAFDLVGIGILPVVDRFSVYGKLGVYHGTVDGHAAVGAASADVSDDATDLTFGFGAAFDIMRQVALRAEWQRYNDVGGSDTGKDDIDVMSVGLLFRF